MAYKLSVNAVDRTPVLQEETLTVDQVAGAITTTCSFTLVDATATLAVVAKQVVLVEETVSGMVYFEGRIADVDYEEFGTGRLIHVNCQDYNMLASEYVIDALEEYGAANDSAIIDDLFTTYLPAVNSVAHVDTLHAFAEISFENMTLAAALNKICQISKGMWYIDDAKNLHYFSAEAWAAPWDLSDTPDNITTFPYHDMPERKEDATQVVTRVLVIGADVAVWDIDAAAEAALGDQFGAITRDSNLVGVTDVTDRGAAITDRYSMPLVTYIVKVTKEGLQAGMDIGFKCGLYGVNDTLTIRRITITWPQSVAEYELEIGDVPIDAATAAGGTADQIDIALRPILIDRLPVCSRGWAHDLVFTASDHNTVAWTAGTITTADGTVFNIAPGADTGNMGAGTIFYIYLDTDVSLTALQTIADVAASAIGVNKILIAVAKPNADAAKLAEFQVFGGEGVSVFITADNIAANTITGNEIAANTILAGNIAAGAIETDELAALAVTAAKIAANTITADKLTIGGTMFNVDDGLLLLGPANRIETDTWYGTRSERASISGAFHQDQGRWQFSRGLVIERTTTNHIANPSFEVDNSEWAGQLGAAVARVATNHVFGTACGSATWPAVNGTLIYSGPSAAGTFLQDDLVSVSVYLKWVSGTKQAQLGFFEYTAADAWLKTQQTAITLTSQWTRYTFTHACDEATCDHVRMFIGESDDTATNFLMDAAQLEKWSWPSSYCDGSLGEGYSWAGTAHASTSTRTATYVSLDEFIPLIDDNDTLTHVVRARMPWDSDFTPSEAGWLTPFLFTYRDDATNDQVLLYYNTADDKFKVNVNGNALASLESSAQTFSEGDEILFVVTLDYAADDYNLYIDGVLEDNATGAETAPSGIDHWNLGSEEDDGAFPCNFGGVISEYAVLDGVMTAAEVGNLYNLQRPITDLGAHNAPGIYVLDGQFAVASSTTGARVHMDADGIEGYNSSEKTFELNSDGSGQIGADSHDPITWDTTGLIDKLKAVQMNVGEPIIDSENCLMLLGPYSIKSETEWKASRGASATISGAFHTEQGYWDGSRALVIEGATTNYELAPRMLDDDSSGVADGWAYADNLGSGGSATTTVVPHPVTERGWLQRIQYTGAAGDVSDYCLIYDFTAVGSFAQDDNVTVSVDLKGRVTGCKVRFYVRECDAAAAGGTTHVSDITPGWALKRHSYTFTAVDADCSLLQVAIQLYEVDNADEFDVYFGAVNIEKTDHPTSFCCGALDWCSWSGAADASTSTRTATEVNLDDYVSLLSDQAQLSFIIWAQMPYDHDADWPSATFNYLFDTRKAAGAQFLLVGYNPTAEEFQFHNGALIENGPTESFNAGDWKLIALTADFTEDEYYLYIDGELGAYSTDAQATGTVVDWTLGCIYNGSAQGNFNIGYHVALDRVLTPDEISRIWNSGKAPVDMGAMDKPGIYILDGHFKIASSSTGNRIEITADEIAGYNGSDDKQFYIQASDGKAYFGGGSCMLDESGETLIAGDSGVSTIKWRYSTLGGDVIAQTYGAYAGAGNDASAFLAAYVPAAGANAKVTLSANDAATDVRFNVNSNGTVDATACTAFQINNGSYNMIKLSGGDAEFILGDAAGAKQLKIMDSALGVVAIINSDGDVVAAGDVQGSTVISTGNVECEGIETDTGDVWIMGDYSAGVLSPSGYVPISINGTQIYLLAYKP